MKKFTYQTLLTVVSDLNKKILTNRIANITMVNSRDLLISFSIYKKEKLFISLSHAFPFVSFIEVNESIPTVLGINNDSLRKFFRDGLIKGLTCLNDDRILQIEIEKTNEYFVKETRYLIFELIPHRTNMIITDNNKIVLFALHYSSLSDKYLVMKNMKYEPVEKSKNFSTEQEYFSLLEMKNYAKEFLKESLLTRKNEKFNTLIKHISSKEKSLKNKLVVLNQEMEKASKSLVYQQYGNTILSLINDKEELEAFIKDNSLDFDKNKSVGENANSYFKKYKKAKRTLLIDKEELIKTNQEIEKYTTIKASLQYLDEDDLFELGQELLPHKYVSINKTTKIKLHSILVDNVKIYYGKNSFQNEEITFKLADKGDYYLHIKDFHGSHILIKSNNPTNEQKTVAAELAIILSGKQDGEVYITQIKNVKKGNRKGEVFLLNYSTILLKNIRNSTKELIKNN